MNDKDDLMCPRCRTIFSVYEAHMKYLTSEIERLTTENTDVLRRYDRQVQITKDLTAEGAVTDAYK